MTEEVAGGPVEEQGTSPVPGDQSPTLDDTQQRARASDVEEPAPSAPSVWPQHAWATANPRSDLEFRSPGADLGCWQYQAAVPSCLVDRVNPALLAYVLHLPPSAVLLVSDYRFRRSAQRLARLTL